MICGRLFFVALFLLIPPAARAQSRLDCPRPVREPRYRTGAKPYLELGAGLSRPFLYYNAAGGAGEGHRFISRLNPYAAGIAVLPLNDQLSVYGGISVMQIWQGLGFHYEDSYGAINVRSYAGSLVYTLPLGIRYRSGERLFLNAGPYLSYAVHRGQSEKSQAGGSGSKEVYSYSSPDEAGLNAGLRLSADVALSKRFLISLSCSADAFRSAAGYSRAEMSGRTEVVFEGAMEPHLLHAGVGLAYRLFTAPE